MSEPTTPQPQKEIDLLEVTGKAFTGIGRGFRNVFRWIKSRIESLFRFFVKHFWVLSALLFLGAAAGYTKARLQKPFFQTEMLVETQLVSRAQIAERVNSLQRLIGDRNNAALAQRLGLSIDEVKNVFFVKADLINVRVVEASRKRDTVEEHVGPQFMRIRIRVWDNASIGRMEQALVTFIESDPYVHERLVLSQRTNMAQQEAIEEQIAQLMLFQQKNIEKSSLVMTAGTTPLMVHNEERTYVGDILGLKDHLFALQAAYELVRPVTIVQPFLPFENPVDRRLINILFFAALFFVIGYGFLLFREGWKRV